jgi:hypothetical protein
MSRDNKDNRGRKNETPITTVRGKVVRYKQ